MKNYIFLAIAFLFSPLTTAASSNYFHEEALPQGSNPQWSQVFDSHKYMDSLYGYLHIAIAPNGQKYAIIKLSDDTRNSNLLYGALVCKSKSGSAIDRLFWDKKMSASAKTVEHHYTFKVTCPDSWGVAWFHHDVKVDYSDMLQNVIKALAEQVGKWQS